MEQISNPLKRFREKINMPKQSCPANITEIVQKYPELAEVPMEEIVINEHIVRQLDDARSNCLNCDKSGDELENCNLPVFDYSLGSLRIATSQCAKQKYYFRLKRIERLLNHSRVGKRFMSRTFETFKRTEANKVAYQRCKDYAENFPRENGQGLVLIGGYGTGKTHLAVAVLHELLRKDVAGLFVTVPELLEEIRKTFNGDKGNERNDLLESIKAAEFLILDDLGAEKASDWVREQLFIIINARYEAMLPMVITSNLLLKELEVKVGARTVSRIIEMCSAVILDGDDYRKKRLSGA